MRPSHGPSPAACWAQLHADMRASRACRSRPHRRHWHRREAGWLTRCQSCYCTDPDCDTPANTVPRMGWTGAIGRGARFRRLHLISAALCSYGQAQRLMGVRPRRKGALAAEVEFTAKQCGVYSRVHFRVLVRVRDRGLVSAAAGLCVFPGVCGGQTT